ncbi:MAG: myxococcus cysteine-rich repeat containing protein [Candidatus Peregrinibacteria bacterium]|nr:myxococcus cysteine-rich repeat containing protein [Candidatus Peregrinibacteria bacterium]
MAQSKRTRLLLGAYIASAFAFVVAITLGGAPFGSLNASLTIIRPTSAEAGVVVKADEDTIYFAGGTSTFEVFKDRLKHGQVSAWIYEYDGSEPDTYNGKYAFTDRAYDDFAFFRDLPSSRLLSFFTPGNTYYIMSEAPLFLKQRRAFAESSDGLDEYSDAACLGITAPDSINAGNPFTASVTLANTGSTVWTPSAYKLVSWYEEGNSTWGLSQVSLSGSTVTRGNSKTFTFNATAPSGQARTVQFAWSMHEAGKGGFGEICTKNIRVVQLVNAAECKVITAPARVALREKFDVTVRMMNSGTTLWTKANGYKLTHSPANSNAWGIKRVELGAADAIAEGQEHTFTFSATGTSLGSNQTFHWKMAQELPGQAPIIFGVHCPHKIEVYRPVCGNAKREYQEACDDDNTDSFDGCSATCTVERGFRCTEDANGKSTCNFSRPNPST